MSVDEPLELMSQANQAFDPPLRSPPDRRLADRRRRRDPPSADAREAGHVGLPA
ncbi:hypothetical protein [Micromonospora arida]|uniref:hypothetical protein n=1 Tax=Micromonospora arida TaxID=2203715 RepID=UPI003CE9B994